MTSKTLCQGAEAIITKEDNQIIKNRIKKSYRISEIDNRLRKSRTRSEAKIIIKLEKIIPVPKILKTDEKEIIEMQYINGKKLSENLELLNYKEVCKLIAENISKMHNQDIIHGDLTTSNMIYVDEDNDSKINQSLFPNQNSTINNIKNNKISSKQASMRACEEGKSQVYFIDFGLASHSSKIEDKAVDLHLLQQALEAKHFTIWQECFKIILNNYNPKDSEEIKKRIKIIESRGRYKDKY